MAESDISRRLSLQPTSSLPLPRALRQNKSFTQLARFIGFSATDDKQSATESGSDADEGAEDDAAMSTAGDDDDQDAEVDEESLMWDAQTALIAHQPALAAKYYATAALPPHSSPAACLALGNLLARGSGLAPVEGGSPPSSTSAKSVHHNSPGATRLPQLSWFALFFRPQPATAEPSPSITEDAPAPRVKRLASNGWELPTDGKRVVRNVEAMGKAGGWLVLGIGLIIEAETNRAPKLVEQRRRKDGDDDGVIVFSKVKGKGCAGSHNNITEATTLHSPQSTASSETVDSLPINTPDDEHDALTPSERIKLLYNLLTPLVQLYRHGHIQRHDPVALPPISHSQLPRALNPKGDKERGRNTWYVGSAVASMLLDLPLLTSTPSLGKEASARRDGVLIMANYIRGMTSSAQVAEPCFKRMIRLGPCGLELPDELIRQAYRRLKSVLMATGGSPVSSSDLEPYPSPTTPDARARHRRRSNASWVSAADSAMTTSLRLMTPVKSTASLASLAFDSPLVESAPIEVRQGATSTLRDIQIAQRRIQSARESPTTPKQPWWPSIASWSMSTPRQTVQNTTAFANSAHQTQHRSLPHEYESASKKEMRKPQLRIVASSPQLHSHLASPPPSSRSSSRLLPFEPKEAIASIDPELAALELASALTKHVQCSVCGADGVNFPNCRKCGLTFCSRPCRIDEKGAGNGKRHVCGVWESRKLQSSPTFAPPSGPQPVTANS